MILRNLSIYSSSLILVGALLNAVMLSYKNKTKQRRRAEILAPYGNEKDVDGGIAAWMELGDAHPDFIYKL